MDRYARLWMRSDRKQIYCKHLFVDAHNTRRTERSSPTLLGARDGAEREWG